MKHKTDQRGEISMSKAKPKIRIIKSFDEVEQHMEMLCKMFAEDALASSYEDMKNGSLYYGIEALLDGSHIWCIPESRVIHQRNPKVLMCVGKCVMLVNLASFLFGCLADVEPVSQALYRHICSCGVKPIKVNGMMFDKYTLLDELTA